MLAQKVLSQLLMKRAAFKVHPDRGWIRTTLAPINDKRSYSFGLLDIVMFSSLVVLLVAVARVFIAR